MDVLEKEGLVVIQGMGKFGKKSWKRMWMMLYQPSSSGIGRMELYEMKDGPLGSSATASRPPGLKRMEKRVIRLADCLSISPAPEESCPHDFSAFDVNTTQRTYTFAAPSNEDWLQTLCELAFLKSSGYSDARQIPRGEDTSMSENELYLSWKAGQYQVKVQQTEAAIRCQLAGSYALSLSSEALSLLDRDTSEVIYCWPYRLLRRFGTFKDGGVTIEAGRRCESGEGLFIFLSKQGQEIYQGMEEAIAKQTGRQQGTRPGQPAPEQGASLSLIPKPLSFEKQRSSTPPQPALQRRNISLPDIPQPTLQQQQPSSQTDIYSVIEMPHVPKPQLRPPRMRQQVLPNILPTLGSRDRDEEERCDAGGSDSFFNANEESVVYAKLSGAHHDAFEEVSNCQEHQESAYSSVAHHSPSPRRAQLEMPRERVVVEEEEGEDREGERVWGMKRDRERERLKERQRDWSKEREHSKADEEEESSQVVTTTSEISVNFKQTLANMLFKDLAKVQLQAAKPAADRDTDSDASIYQNRLDM